MKRENKNLAEKLTKSMAAGVKKNTAGGSWSAGVARTGEGFLL